MTVSGTGPPQQPPPAADPDDEGPTRGVGRLVLRFLLAIGPLVVVLGVVAAGDQRRWPVIADAAVADGTGLRIVEPEPGADPNTAHAVERIGPDGIERIGLPFARGPEEVGSVAGSARGWVALTTFAWSDGRPEGEELWRRTPAGRAERVAALDPEEVLEGVADGGTVLTSTAGQDGAIRFWKAGQDRAEALTTDDIWPPTDDLPTSLLSTSIDPRGGHIVVLLRRGAIELSQRVELAVALIDEDGEVELHDDLEDLEDLDDIGGAEKAQIFVAGDRVTAVGPSGAMRVLPRVGSLDDGLRLDTTFVREHEIGRLTALTDDGGLVHVGALGVERDGVKERYVASEEQRTARDDLAEVRPLGVTLPRPAQGPNGVWSWLLGVGAAGAGIVAFRPPTEQDPRIFFALAVVVSLLALAGLALHALWGWPFGLLGPGVLAAGATAGLVATAIASPRWLQRHRGRERGQRLPDPPDPAPSAPRWAAMAGAIGAGALLLGVALASLAVGDRRTAPLIGNIVDPTGRPHFVGTDAGAERMLLAVSVLDGAIWARRASPGAGLDFADQDTARAATDGSIAVLGSSEERAQVEVLGADGSTRTLDVGARAVLLGLDDSGAIVTAEPPSEPGTTYSDAPTSPVLIIRRDAAGERRVVARFEDLDMNQVQPGSRSDPRSGLVVLLTGHPGPTVTIDLTVTAIDRAGDAEEIGTVDRDQIDVPLRSEQTEVVLGPDQIGLLNTRGFLALRPAPAAVVPLQIEAQVDTGSLFGSPGPASTGAALAADGTLLLPSPWASVAPDGDVTFRYLESCEGPSLVAESCRVEIGGIMVPRPWRVVAHVALGLAALVAALAAAATPRRSTTRALATAALATVLVIWLAGVLRLTLWDGGPPAPEPGLAELDDDDRPGVGSVVAVVGAYAAVVAASVALWLGVVRLQSGREPTRGGASEGPDRTAITLPGMSAGPQDPTRPRPMS